MVLTFIPYGNASEPLCTGIEQFNNLRPTPDTGYLNTNIALFAISTSIFALTIPLAWMVRRQPRFDKIRPFSLTALLMVLLIFYNTSALLSFTGTFQIIWERI